MKEQKNVRMESEHISVDTYHVSGDLPMAFWVSGPLTVELKGGWPGCLCLTNIGTCFRGDGPPSAQCHL